MAGRTEEGGDATSTGIQDARASAGALILQGGSAAAGSQRPESVPGTRTIDGGLSRRMADARELAPVIVVVGLALVGLGALAWLGGLSWFGRLPGDIRIDRDGLRVFVPVTSMLLVSVALSLLAALLRRLV